MNFELRTMVIGLAAFSASGLAGAAIVPFVASRPVTGSARERALFLARLRLLPATLATTGGIAAATAFLVFESRKPFERIAWTFVALAACAVCLLVMSAVRWARLVLDTRRATRVWLKDARPVALAGIAAPVMVVESEFPIVAVVGLFRSRLILARSVLASCTSDELRAVLAHEQGHVMRRDNLRRLAMTAAPDVLAWLPISARLFSDWYNAAEEAADDEAAHTHRDGRLHLASALVKVARLATGTARAVVPASALYSGSNVEFRVRRLLAPAEGPVTKRFFALGLGLMAAIAVIALAASTPIVHELIEKAIHRLP